MFERFPSLTRFSHGWTITEKLDGTNAAINIVLDDESSLGDVTIHADSLIARVDGFGVFAQNRSKLITPGKSTDNNGFARFVQDNAEEIVAKLGEGRHFGEWVGKGINKRHYNLPNKQFALFNVNRWEGADLPENITTVPSIVRNAYLDDPGSAALEALHGLRLMGSHFGPRKSDGSGYDNPEGVVMYHAPSNTAFKKTFDYDELGKWAEKSN